MRNLGNGYKEQGKIADRFAIITWDNGADKFCRFRLDIETGDWARTDGNHNKQLPKWVWNAIA